MTPSPIVLALALASASAAAQTTPSSGSTTPPRRDGDEAVPITVQADEIRGRPDLETVATGNAELRRGPLSIRADELSYDTPQDLARARGSVQVTGNGNVFTGPELQLHLQSFQGYFLDPTYFFMATGAGGRAKRIDFLDRYRATVTGATYSSCPADDPGGPDWELSASRLRLDFEANEGIAQGAVLRFLGVPILGAPVLSFPLTEERKSGWLPPTLNLDNNSGLEVSVPYYWNIAPQRDATFTPGIATRRGVSLDSEFRWLEPFHSGQVNWHVLPDDRVADRSRNALRLRGDADVPNGPFMRLRYTHVSDDDYWKDFSEAVDSWTPRLLAQDLSGQRDFRRNLGDLTLYGRVQHWQVLRDENPAANFTAPYQRSPQLGMRVLKPLLGGLDLDVETEVNRFTLPEDEDNAGRPDGVRWHVLGSLSRSWGAPGWWITPKLVVNAASYRVDTPLADGREEMSRVIPTASVDSGLRFERSASWFGRSVRQTLEPRLLYVNTPYREQSNLPNFDAAGKDFNFDSIYTDNSFSGVDRVSDAHQLTAGATTRLLDPSTGAELLALGAVQRYLFREQRITPEGVPFTERFSDVLLLGSTSLVPNWKFDASLQYSPDIGRTTRSILGARYSPGPYRTIGTTYRFARGLSEQVELAWQWPLYGPLPDARVGRARSPLDKSSGSSACKGSFYTVGRINYSTRDSRLTDALLGLEYDAGCWIGRIVAERLSTGLSEATTRLMLQLELVGLSRLGSNPLQRLKDNIPGYRLLREERETSAETSAYD